MRCRKAHWYLSARCDGTLSERQRLRLEVHLDSCVGCRREAFYFSEVGTLATRMAPHSVQPDFDLRLRSAIRRAEDAAAHPVTWQSRLASLLLRPALVGASVVVLGLGGLGTWSIMRESKSLRVDRDDAAPAVNPEYGLNVRYGDPSVQSGELIPVSGLDAETRRLQERYLKAGQLPMDYVLEGVRLEEATWDSSAPRYVLPTVSPDQVAKKVSY